MYKYNSLLIYIIKLGKVLRSEMIKEMKKIK